jgi:hypothetical protein
VSGEVVITMSPVAVTRETAAAALGMGLTMFSERVQPELKVIRVGAKVLIRPANCSGGSSCMQRRHFEHDFPHHLWYSF